MSYLRQTSHDLTKIKKGDLIVGKIEIFNGDSGLVVETVYGLAVDILDNNVDVQLPQSYRNLSESNNARTELGIKLDQHLRELLPWSKNQSFVISIEDKYIVRHYAMFNKSPVDISMKSFIQQLFQYFIPRYVNHSTYDINAVEYWIEPTILCKDGKYKFSETIIDSHKNAGESSIPYINNFVSYSKPKAVRDLADNHDGSPIMLHRNNFGFPDFVEHLDGLPSTNTSLINTKLVPTKDTLVFGHPQQSDKGIYFSEWFVGNSSALLFYTLLFYEDHPTFYKREHGTLVKMTQTELVNKLLYKPVTGTIPDSIDHLQYYWTKNYISYKTPIPDMIWYFLYICIQFERPEDAISVIESKFSIQYQHIFASLFKFIVKK